MNPASRPGGHRIDPRQNATAALPWSFAGAGGTALVSGNAKVRQFFETFLFTVPGERVNRPTYGAGVLRLVFGGASQVEETLRQAIETGLAQELIDLVEIEAVASETVDSTVRVTVRYKLRRGGPSPGTDELNASFTRPV
jgi:phage baseplate assembly protein W